MSKGDWIEAVPRLCMSSKTVHGSRQHSLHSGPKFITRIHLEVPREQARVTQLWTFCLVKTSPFLLDKYAPSQREWPARLKVWMSLTEWVKAWDWIVHFSSHSTPPAHMTVGSVQELCRQRAHSMSPRARLPDLAVLYSLQAYPQFPQVLELRARDERARDETPLRGLSGGLPTLVFAASAVLLLSTRAWETWTLCFYGNLK
mmetsp:Transcript_84895/g.155642  ORF Transcript_84895/g.155642 Transcript_84895/m.155642 type:complete len:202 (-) Transcript_84895:2862-3467(-)